MARKGDEITSGQELNSYEGNANLGTGEGSGYARPDLSPLTTFAQNLYRTHQIDFEQQQKDKSKLEDLYNDPKIYLQLDKNYADQLAPLNQQILELGKKNLQMDPNGEDWYKFMDTHNQLVSENAKLKAVQDTKNQYKKLSDESADPHEKERINAYVDQLNNYKLGQEIPAYNKYFAFDEAKQPDLKVASGTRQEVSPDGKKIRTIKFSSYNPINADKIALDQSMKDPTVLQNGVDLAHTLLTHGTGITELNKAIDDTYKKGLVLNISPLQDKYKKEFIAYQKDNPNGTFRDFMNASGRSSELDDVYDGMNFMKRKDPALPVVQFVSADVDKGQKLSGFTYSDDGTKRLNVDDNTLRTYYQTTKNPPGTKDEVVDEKINLDPKTEFEAAQRLKVERENRASAEKINANTQANENYRKGLDLIGKGWTRDAKGKLQPPTKSSAKTADGIVPYWQNYIQPQIDSKKFQFAATKKSPATPVPKDYSGDVDVTSDSLSGLSVALLGETTAEGKPRPYNEKTKTRIRFKDGKPTGVVIDGVFYDQNDINSKATRINDKSVNNKFDAPVFDDDGQPVENNAALSAKTFDIVNPKTGQVVLSGVSEEKAKAAEAKGYKRK